MWVNPGEVPGNGIDDDGNGFVDDVYGYDFADNDGDPGPGTGHGTRTAGIAASAGNDGTGIAGMAWDASIMALKIFSDDGTGSVSAAVEAFNYAAMMRSTYGVNIRVTNNSWVVDFKTNSLLSAVRADGDAGILTVAAAGNGSYNVDNSPLYPAAFNLDSVISVAGTDRYDHLADFSVWGPTSVDLAAPGANIYAPTPGGYYSYGSGVSYSTPFVAGVAALAWSAAPDATLAQVRSAIFEGVDPLPSLAGKVATGGRLNALKTLQELVLQVAGSTPVAGSTVTSAPTIFTIDFSLPLDAASVDAGDLLVNGVAGRQLQRTRRGHGALHLRRHARGQPGGAGDARGGRRRAAGQRRRRERGLDRQLPLRQPDPGRRRQQPAHGPAPERRAGQHRPGLQ